jgi:hypothetical protein
MFRGRNCVGARNSDVRGQIKENRFGQPLATLIATKREDREPDIVSTIGDPLIGTISGTDSRLHGSQRLRFPLRPYHGQDQCHGNSDADFGEPMYGDLPHGIRPGD